jgi:transcriptional regulator with XRE-family HTH domain
MPNPDDERLGHQLRAIRRRTALTQVDLARLAGIPAKELRRIENGNAGNVSLGRIRSAFDAAGARARLVPWWNGAAADRLLDEAHAALVETATGLFSARGWQVKPETSFSEFGERGSIDLLAAHPRHRAVAACEIKSTFGSLEDTNRTLDLKVRLAPKISERVFGWKPSVVGRILVVPNDSTIRRIVERHAATMHAIYPARSRDVRAWLRTPTTDLAAIWFVSIRRTVADDQDD